MTYTIVVADRATRSIGLAVASHSLNVTHKVAHVQRWPGGGGVIASQAFSSPALAAHLTEALTRGDGLDEAMEAVLSRDTGREFRQLLVASSSGGVAAKTGTRCVPASSDIVDRSAGFAAAGNMLVDDTVLPAAASAFLSSPGTLAERLLAAIGAASAAGGDFRGDRSAGLLVLSPDNPVDLRVEEAVDPIGLLSQHYRRVEALAVVSRCYGFVLQAPPDVETGQGLLRALERAAEEIPDPTLGAWARVVADRIGEATSLRLTSPGQRLYDALTQSLQTTIS